MAITSGPLSRTLFIGLSTDAKPAGTPEFASMFYEYDTGKTYIWTGSAVQDPNYGSWVEYLPLYPTAQDFMNPAR